MIKSEMGMVKAGGCRAELLADLQMIIEALRKANFSESTIQEAVDNGFSKTKKEVEKIDLHERKKYLDELLKKLGLEED